MALSKWGRVPDVAFVDAEQFYKNHKGLQSGMATDCIERNLRIYAFYGSLGPERLTIARDFLFSATPSYWIDGSLAVLPPIFGKLLSSLLS